MRTVTLHITGMTCAGCVASVERALKRAPGVQSVQVSLAAGQAEVILDESRTTPADIATIVASAGFAVVAP